MVKLFYEEHNPILEECIKKINNYFSNEKDYNFQYYSRKHQREYTLKSMFGEILPNLYFKQVHHKIDKKEFIRLTFNLIENYVSELNQVNKKKLTSYKMKVISGYIAIAFGYGITNVTPLTNDAIFQATRNSFKK